MSGLKPAKNKAPKKRLTAKERYKNQLLEYLSDPRNDWPTRTDLARKVLKIAYSTFKEHFRPPELCEIEQEALDLRRKNYAAKLRKIDDAMLRRAAKGDVNAAKLAYERYEGWGRKLELEGKGGFVIQVVKYTDKIDDGKDD